MSHIKNQIEVELAIYKDLDVLRADTVKNAVYFVYSSAAQKVTQIWVTTNKNVPKQVELFAPITLKTITSPNGTIEVVETSSEIQLELEASILALINSSLQAGDNISSLVNDSGYITISDVPPFVPSDYDLEEFNNNGADPYAHQSEIITYTDEQAQDAIGTILLDTATIDLSYNDGTPSISADVRPNSITANELSNSINISEFVNDNGYEVTSNKTSTVAGNESSTSLYLNILGAVTWFQQKLTDSIFGNFITSLNPKTTIVDGDTSVISDGADTNKAKKVTWANIFNYIKSKSETEISYACSDEVSDLAVGTLITFRMPFGMTITNLKLSLNTAPTGTKLIVDVRKNGVTILSTLISADISSTTSVGASVPYVISDSNLTDDSIITILTTQVGSTIAGKGLKVTFLGKRI